MATSDVLESRRPLVQIATYNTNLQGNQGLPQDLVDWLSPSLHVSQFLSHSEKRAPDFIAVGFQELLPLHLGLSGLSKSVIENRDVLIRSQIEKHAPNNERYSLVAKIVNVGVALLVYARDDTVAQRVCDVQSQWSGCGPGWMGNKGAVGVRFRMRGDENEEPGEIYTFVCAHLTAHQPKLENRIADYNHIVSTLLFPSLSSPCAPPTTLYATSHLFIFGDLNFRLTFPQGAQLANDTVHAKLEHEDGRAALKECDQLLNERRRGRVFVGLREGKFWDFRCTYKYKLGTVDHYSAKRTPAWTDRILYTTYTDSEDTPEESAIENLAYTSVPSYTTSDHKPVVALLQLPIPVTSDRSGTSAVASSSHSASAPSTTSNSASSQSHSSYTTNTSIVSATQPPSTQARADIGPPLLRLPASFHPKPDSLAPLKRLIGRSLDRIVGVLWCLLWAIGAGNAGIGLGNMVVALGVWGWWMKRQG